MSIDSVAAQLGKIFGDRLVMVAAFGSRSQSCAVVRSVTIDDLDHCAALMPKWDKLGVDVPLFIVQEELARALDAFPLELTEIMPPVRSSLAKTSSLRSSFQSPTCAALAKCRHDSCAAPSGGLYRGGRGPTGHDEAGLRRCAAVSRPGHQRGASGRHFPEGTRHSVEPREF